MIENNPLIRIENVSKLIKKKQILYPFNYNVSEGKILAICGGNGAGKSTLIRLITGVMTPTSGNIFIRELEKTKNRRKYSAKIGYMPDQFSFEPSISVFETIYFYAQLKRLKKKRSEDVLKEVGLWDKRNLKVGHLSKGMNQRLLLAQALLAKPSILILDEPTNGLDPYWIKQLSELLLKAKENGQTVIFSTHDLHAAEQIADEVIFLHNGEIISQGPIYNYLELGLYNTYQSLYFSKLVHDI